MLIEYQLGYQALLNFKFFVSAAIPRSANVVLCEVRTIKRAGKLSWM